MNNLVLLLCLVVLVGAVTVDTKTVSKSLSSLSKKVNVEMALVVFLGVLVVLCLMKSKKTVEGLCGCMTGANFDTSFSAGTDLNCPTDGNGNFLDSNASEACDCTDVKQNCQYGYETYNDIVGFLKTIPQDDNIPSAASGQVSPRRTFFELALLSEQRNMTVEQYLNNVLQLTSSEINSLLDMIDGEAPPLPTPRCGCNIESPSGATIFVPVSNTGGDSLYNCYEDLPGFVGPDANCNCNEPNVTCSYGYISEPINLFYGTLRSITKEQRRQLIQALTNETPERFVARILVHNEGGVGAQFGRRLIPFFGLNEADVDSIVEGETIEEGDTQEGICSAMCQDINVIMDDCESRNSAYNYFCQGIPCLNTAGNPKVCQ